MEGEGEGEEEEESHILIPGQISRLAWMLDPPALPAFQTSRL
jgi:hypothetical protein